MFVYFAINEVNLKMYVGKSVDPAKRWDRHLTDAKYGSHYAFHRAIRKYGENKFHFAILEECETEQQSLGREMYWISTYDTLIDNGKGYNMTLGGEGVRPSPEVNQKRIQSLRKAYECPIRRQIRKEMMLEKWQDPEYIKKHSEAMNDPEFKEKHKTASIAKWQDAQFREKHLQACNTADYKQIKQEFAIRQWQDPEYRQLRQEIWESPEHKAIHSAAMNDPEHLERIRKTSLDQWATPGFRDKWYDVMQNVWTSEEHVEKQRQGAIKQWANEEFQKKNMEMRQTPEFKEKHIAGIRAYYDTPDRRNRDARIIELRGTQGLTQVQIGKLVGVSSTTVHNVLKKHKCAK